MKAEESLLDLSNISEEQIRNTHFISEINKHILVDVFNTHGISYLYRGKDLTICFSIPDIYCFELTRKDTRIQVNTLFFVDHLNIYGLNPYFITRYNDLKFFGTMLLFYEDQHKNYLFDALHKYLNTMYPTWKSFDVSENCNFIHVNCGEERYVVDLLPLQRSYLYERAYTREDLPNYTNL